MTSKIDAIKVMAYSVKLIRHILSLIPDRCHRVHTDCPVVWYEDSVGFFMDDEWVKEMGTGNKGEDSKRGTI